jgi:hypothetical protein
VQNFFAFDWRPQRNRTRSLYDLNANDTGHNRAKARTNPDAIPLLVKNFKKDGLKQPF